MKITKLKLHWQVLVGMLLGALLGVASRWLGFEAFVAEDFALVGDLFLKALKMIIVPLIVSSIMSGVVSLGGSENLGRLGLKTVIYYITTSLFAIMTGLFLVNWIQPGVGAEVGLTAVPEAVNVSAAGSIKDIILGMIPNNPVAAAAKGEILPLILFSLLFGFFLTRIRKNYSEKLTDLVNAVFETMMQITHFIIRFTPLGVMSIVAKIVAQTGFEVFFPLLTYMMTVASGLFFHAVVTLPLLLFFIGGVNPLAFARAMSTTLLTAFSTSSSSATLPVTMHSLENSAGASNKVTSFVLPLGATVNMDGTALYECIVVMFIAQVYGIELTFAQQFFVVITALLTSIGAAGIPMASLVMISVILQGVGLPLEGIGLILAVDRILDMMRTVVNVWSDSCGAIMIARSEGETGLKVLRENVGAAVLGSKT